MAWIQFVSGSRDQDVVELNDTASLILGSSPESHIQVEDPDVAPKHCQIYFGRDSYWVQDLGQGRTVLDMKRLQGETKSFRQGNVLIVGRTYIKFWGVEPPALSSGPAAGSGAGPVTDDPAATQALAAAQQEAEDVRAELEAARAKAEAAERRAEEAGAEADGLRRAAERAGSLEEDLARTREQLADLRRELEGSAEELRQAQAALDSRGSQEAELSEDLQEAKQLVKMFRQEVDEREAEIGSLGAALEERDGELKEARAKLSKAQGDARRLEVELDDARRLAEQELERAKREAEARGKQQGRADLKPRLDEVEATLSATRSALTAAHDALRARGVEPPRQVVEGLELGGEAADLGAALDALKLAEGARRRLEQAIAAEIDRQTLGQSQGPSLAWGPPARPGGRDVPRDLAASRRRAEGLDLAERLGTAPGL